MAGPTQSEALPPVGRAPDAEKDIPPDQLEPPRDPSPAGAIVEVTAAQVRPRDAGVEQLEIMPSEALLVGPPRLATRVVPRYLRWWRARPARHATPASHVVRRR